MMSHASPATITGPGAPDEIGIALRQALRRLAKAVVVITTVHEGQRFAMAATAVSELSMDPPSMLICVNQTASLHAPLAAGAPFCINILDAAQQSVAAHCSGPVKGEQRFEIGSWTTSAGGVSILAGAQASIVCEQDQRVAYGTHAIFIGQVVEVVSGAKADPLVYVDGRYTRCHGDAA
jgi:flavin reductase (DIM6/NTAB) family NADH-FMN oxidoreductase RutF